MSHRWILFGIAATLLGLGAWYFGRPVLPKEETPPQRIGAAPTPAAEAPKELPPRVVEVIDLARAYEPVRDVEPPLPGDINAASFIEEQYAPARIPYAVDDENSPQVHGCCFWFLPSIEYIRIQPRVVPTVHLDVMPREVADIQNGLLNFIPNKAADGGVTFTPT